MDYGWNMWSSSARKCTVESERRVLLAQICETWVWELSVSFLRLLNVETDTEAINWSHGNSASVVLLIHLKDFKKILMTACCFHTPNVLKTLIFCLLVCLFRAVPTAHGGSQARGQIAAVVSGLCHSHSNSRSEPHLQTTRQLVATPDP